MNWVKTPRIFLGLYFLAPIVKREVDDYAVRLKADKIKKFKNV